MKYNNSKIIMPVGKSRQEAKSIVMKSNLSEGEKFVLFYALDQSVKYVLTVAQIRHELSWGEKRWKTVRTKLANKEILQQKRIPLANKSSMWTLNFNLLPLFDSAKIEKNEEKSRYHTCAQSLHAEGI